MILCDNCYHNKVCEYKSCYKKRYKKNCLYYKNENLIYEWSLELGTPYYRIETRYECNYGEKCEVNISCNTCPYYVGYFTLVKYTYRPTLFSEYKSLGKFYLNKEEAEKELERLNGIQENKND